jgi:hypothetical protein
MRRERRPANDYWRATCTAAEQIGDFVYNHAPMEDGRLVVRTCDARDRAKMPAWGMVVRKLNTTECVVQRRGPVAGIYEDLELGIPYYVDGAGGLDSARTRPGYAQITGHALSSTVFWVEPQLYMIGLLA